METGKMRLALSAGALALSMALAGCGGGGSSTAGVGDRDGQCEEGYTGTPPNCVMVQPPKPLLSYVTDLDTSVAALMTLAATADKDGSALKMATDNAAKIRTLASDGNSRAAMMSAQMVLDARERLMQAIETAKSARSAATDAKDDTEDTHVTAVLNGAIARAATQIDAAEKVLKSERLRIQVGMVTGCPNTAAGCTADTTPKAPGRDAAYHGKQVADAIATALGSSGGSVMQGETGPVAADIAKENRFSDHDATGMTWAQIVGEGNVMEMTLGTVESDGTLTAGNGRISVASLEGMTDSKVVTDTTTLANVADGAGVAGDYMGIPGAVICLGGTDGCKVTDGKLGTGWYFSPTSPMAHYTKDADDEDYSEETLYATYGHWLTVSGSAATVHTFAYFGGTDGGPGDNEIGSWAAADPAATDAGLKLSTATYSGKAAGRSVYRAFASDGSQTGIHSGRFTADVTLTAKFAGTPMLGGMIDNFQSPDNAVGNWTVKLMDAVVDTTSENGSVGADTPAPVDTTPANVNSGGWRAQSYGENNNKRPTGIYGDFRAHFTNGDVAGAFATRRQ